MNPYEWCEKLFFGTGLEDKLSAPDQWSIKDFSQKYMPALEMPLVPNRDSSIRFSSEQIRFPKNKSFKDSKNVAKAIHFFANHELLAIETMAYAILFLPESSHDDSLAKLGLVQTIVEEQKHLKLYIQRLKELHCSFGDYPLNDFFWEKTRGVKDLKEFLSIMSLTFESANLDFCMFYSRIFEDAGDSKTAQIMETVLSDEIKHVKLGGVYLKKLSKKERLELWEYYCQVLPLPLTPARAKGMVFNREARELAGLGINFINQLENYRDNFQITNRKEWQEK